MRINYNKLIRDKIPEIIQAAGKSYEIEVMGNDEYRVALLEKLVEEAQEAREAPPDKLIVELADLLEVVETIMNLADVSREDVVTVQEKRRNERGGFDKRIKLLWTDG